MITKSHESSSIVGILGPTHAPYTHVDFQAGMKEFETNGNNCLGSRIWAYGWVVGNQGMEKNAESAVLSGLRI